MFWMRILGLPFGTPLLDEEGGDSGLGGDPPANHAAQIEGLKAKYGGAQQALAHLYDENYKLRSKNRDLAKEAEKAKLADGSVVLTADEAKTLEEYRALGKPEELKAVVTERDELKQKVSDGDRQTLLSEAAKAAGWEGKESILKRLVGPDDKVEIRDEQVDGETVKVPYITPAGDGSVPAKLTDHAKSEWSDFLPALGAEGEGDGDSGDGTQFPKQKSTGKAPSNDDAFARAVGGRHVTPSKRKAS